MKYLSSYKSKKSNSNEWLPLNERMRKMDAIADCKRFIENAEENGAGDYECTVCQYNGLGAKENKVVWDSERDWKKRQ